MGGLLLLVAGVLLAVATGLLWMDRVAFTPSPDTGSTFAIVGDEDIRLQIANVVSGSDAATMSISPAALRDRIEGHLQVREMSKEIRGFTADAHARLIGDTDEPVLIESAEQVQLVRSERVALQPPIALPVQRVTSLAVVATATTWIWMVGAGLGLVALVLGLLLRPERGESSFAFAIGCAAIGLSIVTFGYAVPAFVVPALSGDVWVAAIPRLATYRRATTTIAGVVLVVIGAVAFLATTRARQRRARSTPLSVGRFREQQRWSG